MLLELLKPKISSFEALVAMCLVQSVCLSFETVISDSYTLFPPFLEPGPQVVVVLPGPSILLSLRYLTYSLLHLLII